VALSVSESSLELVHCHKPAASACVLLEAPRGAESVAHRLGTPSAQIQRNFAAARHLHAPDRLRRLYLLRLRPLLFRCTARRLQRLQILVALPLLAHLDPLAVGGNDH
jgi:hypothetical protein